MVGEEIGLPCRKADPRLPDHPGTTICFRRFSLQVHYDHFLIYESVSNFLLHPL